MEFDDYVNIGAKFFKLRVVKLPSIVKHNGAWYAKSTYYCLLYKTFSIFLYSSCKVFYLNPFREIVNYDNDILYIPLRYWEGPIKSIP